MKSHFSLPNKLVSTLLFLLWLINALLLSAAERILPTPQFTKPLHETVVIGKGNKVEIVIGARASQKVRLAAEMLKKSLIEINPDLGQGTQLTSERQGNSTAFYLWDCSDRKLPAISLSALEKEVLDSSKHFGQSFLLRTRGNNEIWAVGSSDQGVLYSVVTLLQLLEPTSGGIQVKGIEVRDFPDFRYRVASDWLLRAELNRWAYDWGDGRYRYVERIKRKLDLCTRFKINMVMFDGFAWTPEKVPGYASMMRELNAYSRERGIKLMYSGFGANFDPRKVEPEFNIGKVHLNRRSYPHGQIYACFGESRSPEHPTFGTCRSNEDLNAEIAREFESFVRAVEPGALYIHHEDTGHFETTQLRWGDRCEQCKKRWPNPDFAAIDGGAGAMAHGYSNIVQAVQSVKNLDTGFDASRDCTVVLISPPYGVDGYRSGLGTSNDHELNWNKTLEFWGNAMSLMPLSENLAIGFREIFPHPVTGERWVDAYRRQMLARGLSSKVFLFFLGGADQYSSGVFSFPYTGNSAMNGLFKGAESIYNFNGGLHQEPQQLINAEYSWNTSAPGNSLPKTFKDTLASWNALMKNESLPAEIFGPEGLFEAACSKIYGMRAGAAMAGFFHYYESRKGRASDTLLPDFYPEKIYSLVVLWRLLQGDSLYWNFEPDANEQKVLHNMGIDHAVLHRHIAAFWAQNSEVNRKARDLASVALASSDLRQDAKEDVEYLSRCITVGERFGRLLSAYHNLIAESTSRNRGVLEQQFHLVFAEHKELSEYLHKNFSFSLVDPKGGDQASWLDSLERIRLELLKNQQSLQGAVAK